MEIQDEQLVNPPPTEYKQPGGILTFSPTLVILSPKQSRLTSLQSAHVCHIPIHSYREGGTLEATMNTDSARALKTPHSSLVCPDTIC